ncbi:acyltransferase family protein [Cytobacillus sp. IB215665]|uniref:acyltransferase family protein n=1 Tax=Cytobacillus sp. IB215665 TaxID=3097357 RepID=UPI002A10C2C5|nr:acyltransferase family protein [Cytobacillus sp. IB215665]MDX8365559.1 acyltransferase family protein [Cytobacillus sp. IB215665]
MFDKDLKLTNTKGILIFLVVFGHFLELNKEHYLQTFIFIYAFHMPLFVFISGFLAKRIQMKKVVNLFMLYIIFQTLYSLFFYFVGEYETMKFNYEKPIFHLWYIVSISFWYVLAVIIAKLNPNNIGKLILFTLILLISFFSRLYTDPLVNFTIELYPNFSSYTLSYQRTITFAPFFFAGFFMSNNALKKLYISLSPNIAKGLLLLSAMGVFLFIEFTPNLEWLYKGSYSTSSFLSDNETYVTKILSHFLLSTWLSILILIVINGKKSFLTKWGDHSIGIYLFHPVFVFMWEKINFMNDWNVDTQFIVNLMIALIVTTFLSSNFFTSNFRFLTSPVETIKPLLKGRYAKGWTSLFFNNKEG